MKSVKRKFLVFALFAILLLTTINFNLPAKGILEHKLRDMPSQHHWYRGMETFYIGYARKNTADSAEDNIAKVEFSMLTPENDTKMWRIMENMSQVSDVNTANKYKFSYGDGQQDFAKSNTMKFHGHCLLWHKYNPSWVNSANWTEALMRKYINTVVTHYKNRSGGVYVWDVVNEAFLPDGNMRTTQAISDTGQWGGSVWYQKIGENYIKYAFDEAHKADSNAKLIYNDYDIEAGTVTRPDGGNNLDKFNAILAKMKDLRDNQGMPIDGIGFQMHIKTDFTKDDVAEFARRMQEAADAGFEIYITEMDVKFPASNTNPNMDDYNHQAEIYGWIMKACIEQPACKAVQVWGFDDNDSWCEDPNTAQEDKGNDPLIFHGSNNDKKPAYFAVRNALLAHVSYKPYDLGDGKSHTWVDVWYHGDAYSDLPIRVTMTFPGMTLTDFAVDEEGNVQAWHGDYSINGDQVICTINFPFGGLVYPTPHFTINYSDSYIQPQPWDVDVTFVEGAPAPALYNYLTNDWSGKALTVTNNSNYADVVCQGINTSWTSQQWKLEEITGGVPSMGATVRIKNLWSGKYLTAADTSDFAAVKAQDLNTDWTSQEWIIENSLGGARFKNKWSGRYLTVTSENEYAGVKCQPLNADWESQQWNLE